MKPLFVLLLRCYSLLCEVGAFRLQRQVAMKKLWGFLRGWWALILFGALLITDFYGYRTSLTNVVQNVTSSTLEFFDSSSSESELKAILVSALRDDCADVNEFMLSPKNWTKIDAEFGLFSGDGGVLILTVIPDENGGGNVVISEANKQITNLNLYNSGCKSIAKAPPKPKPTYPPCNRVAQTKNGGWAIVPGWQWQRADGKIGYCILPNSGGEKYYFPGLN